jgi:hypothetical protein
MSLPDTESGRLLHWSPGEREEQRWFLYAAVMLMLCFGMAAVPLQIMHLDLSRIPGDLGDGRLNNYFLEHGYQWITGQVKSFWNAPFMFPTPNTMAFSDNHLGTLPLYALFRSASFDRETSYQLWFISLFALNYLSCAWVLKKWSVSVPGIMAGAYLFAFSMPVIAKINHSQLMPRFMIPISFYLTLAYLDKPKNRTLALICLSVVFQFYCTIYMGYFLVLGLLLTVVAHFLVVQDRSAFRSAMGGSIRGFVVKSSIVLAVMILLAPLMLPYFASSLQYGVRTWSDIKTMLPRFQSYLLPEYGSLLWNWMTPVAQQLPMSWEHHLFIGAVPLSAIVLTPVLYLRKKTDPLYGKSMILTVALLLLVLITIYHGKSIYRIVMDVIPGLRSVRAVTRIILMEIFPVAAIVAVMITRISQVTPGPKNSVVLSVIPFALVLLVAIDQFVWIPDFMGYSKSEAQARSRKVEQMVKDTKPDAAVFAYMPARSADPPFMTHLDAMLAAQHLRIATVNGYSGNMPHEYYSTFYEGYRNCGSYYLWKNASLDKSANQAWAVARDVIVGRDDCSGHSYSLMSEELPEQGFRAQLTAGTNRITVKRGALFSLDAEVKNISTVTWRSLSGTSGKYRLNLSYRWSSSSKTPLGGFDPRFPLPHDLDPGEAASFSLSVKAPDTPGIYNLQFDMVQELVAWFHDKGSKLAQIRVEVL